MAKAGTLRARVDENIQKSFHRAAKALGKGSASALLTELVVQCLKENNMYPSDLEAGSSASDEDQVARGRVIGTRINDDEAEAIDEILQAEQRTTSDFLLNLIRARLTKSPHFSRVELNELRESNRQLLAIGRNLNQYIRAIHDGSATNFQFSKRYAEELKGRVDEQAKKISALINKNKKRDIPND